MCRMSSSLNMPFSLRVTISAPTRATALMPSAISITHCSRRASSVPVSSTTRSAYALKLYALREAVDGAQVANPLGCPNGRKDFSKGAPNRRDGGHFGTSDLPVDSTSPGRFGALLFGSSTGWSRPPRSDGAGTSQGQGEQRIPGPTIVPNSRARRRLRRSKLPGETGSPAMTSGARRSQSTVMPRYN